MCDSLYCYQWMKIDFWKICMGVFFKLGLLFAIFYFRCSFHISRSILDHLSYFHHTTGTHIQTDQKVQFFLLQNGEKAEIQRGFRAHG